MITLVVEPNSETDRELVQMAVDRARGTLKILLEDGRELNITKVIVTQRTYDYNQITYVLEEI